MYDWNAENPDTWPVQRNEGGKKVECIYQNCEIEA